MKNIFGRRLCILFIAIYIQYSHNKQMITHLFLTLHYTKFTQGKVYTSQIFGLRCVRALYRFYSHIFAFFLYAMNPFVASLFMLWLFNYSFIVNYTEFVTGYFYENYSYYFVDILYNYNRQACSIQ